MNGTGIALGFHRKGHPAKLPGGLSICAYGSVEDRKDPDGEGSEATTTLYERRGVHLYAKEIK